MGQNSNNPEKQQHNSTTNQDVVIHLIDVFYNLVNSGNFVGVVLLFVIFGFFGVVWKIPPESLGKHVGTILKVFTADKYYILVLVPTLFFSLFANFIQRKIYKAEISRLINLRSQLIHDKQEGLINSLSNHHPSNFDLDSGE